MTEEVRDWLPLGAIAGNAVRTKIDDVVADWSGRWFAAADIGVASLTPTPGGRMDEGDWRVPGAVVAVHCSRAMTPCVLERALGVRPEGLVLTNADRRLVLAFTERVAEDLAKALERLLGVGGDEQATSPSFASDPFGPLGGVTITVAEGRDQLLTVAVPLQAIVALCKSSLPRTTPATRELTSMVEALKPTHLLVEAAIGRAQMSLADLRGLTPGDIVVLDTAIESGGEISLPNSDVALARAKLGERDGRVTLTLQSRSH